MPLNRDDIQGGLKRGGLSRENARTAVHVYRATGALPSAQTVAQPAHLEAVTANTEKPVRRYKPAYQGEKPAGHEAIPGAFINVGRAIIPRTRPYYAVRPDTRTPLAQAVDAQVTPLLATGSKFASPVVTTPASVAGNVLAQLGGGPTLLSAAEHLKHAQVLPAAGELATLLPFGRFGKAAKAAKDAVALEDAAKVAGASEAERTAAIAAIQKDPASWNYQSGVPQLTSAAAAKIRAVHRGASAPVKPYVNQHLADTGVGSVPDLADAPGFLYHRTEASRFDQIRSEGLKATQPTGDKPSGVYFARHPLEARGLSWKPNKGSVYLRVKQGAVHTFDFHGDARLSGLEHVSPSSVPPQALEYLGADGGWHPLAPSALPASPAETLLTGMKGVARKRGVQDALRSQERGARAAAYDAALKSGNGIEGHRQALAQLKGELPKINYDGFNELTPEALDHLVNVAKNHPNLLPFQKANLIKALDKATQGTLPTPSEQALIEHVFGKETADGFAAISGMPAHLQNAAAEVLNVPRSLMASFDLSAPLRQGLVAQVRHPVITAANWKPMVKAFGSEGSYQRLMEDVRTRPTYPMMNAAKLAITDVEGVSNREEQFFSNLAEKLTGGKKSPVRMSGRAYTGFLVKTRADIFDHLIRVAQLQGRDVQDEQFLRDLGRHINAMTGRGDLPGKMLKESAPFWNTVFFSPRLFASRVHFLNPVTYLDPHTDPFVRREELKAALALAGVAGTILGALDALPGVTVNTDPRNADFGKVRVGNTRLDILGGFQQPIRLVSQLVSGKVVSSTTGKTLRLGPQGPGNLSRYDIATRFAQGKLAPVPSIVVDLFRGTDFADKPFSWKREMAQHMIPLVAQDAHDLYNQPVAGMDGVAAALAGYGVGAFGVGIQTYGPSQDKAFKKDVAVIDQAVKDGRLSPEQAATAKNDLERVHYVQTHDTKQNRRQYLIDTMHEQGYDNAEINKSLHELGYEPVG